MQIRCTSCTKTIAIAPTGVLPPACPHCAGSPVPARLGPYVPQRLLATGGMGEVYVARHADLGTEVAIKLLPALPLDQLAAVRERFAREARLTAKVRHPGVVKVLASDVAGDRPFLVLELVDGVTLRARLDAGPVPIAEAAHIAATAADVLAAAHGEGVLHRDVKPDNVMVQPDGAVRVLDFGIARAVQDDAPLTRTGEIVGTPEYMAPEQLLDGPDAIDERTDVHALGVLTYELLTSRSPFRGANLFQALKLVESLVPPPPSSLRAGVPPPLDAAVLRALHKQPNERFPSARAFADAVRAAVPAARPQAAASPSTSPWLWLVGLLAAAALIVAIGIGLIGAALSGPGFGEALGRALLTAGDPLARYATVESALHDGRFCEALRLAEQSPRADNDFVRGVGEQAFVFAHLAWPLATGAPTWLAQTDAAQRARWLGDTIEEPTDEPPRNAAWGRVLDGVPFDVNDPFSTLGPARAELLSAHLTPQFRDAAPPLHADPTLAGDALARLLHIRLLPPEQHADAFAAYAQRLPIESCEHWLAQMAAHHLQGRTADGTRAAEMAWLSGAGEQAVLLDAYLQIAPGDGTWRTPDSVALARLRKRVAAGDRRDAPAGVLMLALLDAVGGLAQDFAPLRELPLRVCVSAQPWFAAAAAADPAHEAALQRVAEALRAETTRAR